MKIDEPSNKRKFYFCQMRKISFALIAFIALSNCVNAQEIWDLQRIVDYARINNISVRQADVQASISGLSLKQTKRSRYPGVTFNGSTSYSSGRNQDPTYNLVTQEYIGSGMELQTSVDIFNFFSKRNTVMANEWQFAAAKANADKIRNDIALTVANDYLQILLAKEQEKIAQVQLQQTRAQLDYTRKLVKAGSLPELNASELEAQEARDSANYISAKGNVVQTMLVLKSHMNMDAAMPFEVAVPPVEMIPIENISDLQPEAVYALAVVNLPQQRVNDYNLKAARKLADAARSAMYPSISTFASIGSGYNSIGNEIKGFTYGTDTIGHIDIGGIEYPVTVPGTNPQFGKSAFFSQVDQNLRKAVGINISVPIFNIGNLRNNWQRAKLDIKTYELQQETDNQQIKQDIYQAYNAAVVALEKYHSSQKSVAASQRTYEFTQKRYTVGMLGTFELITNLNNLFRAKLESVLNQYDYVFKMKVLEFYRGQGLKL